MWSDTLLPWLFVLLWSTGFIGARYGLPDAGPFTFLALRFAMVVVLMALVALLARAPWPRSRWVWWHIGVSGVLIHGVYLGGVFTAIGLGLPAGVTALVVGVQPLLTALGAGLLLGERVRPAQWGGLLAGFVGVGLVVSARFSGNAPGVDVAAMLWPAVVALLGITLGTLYQKRYCPAFDLRTGSVVQFLPCVLGMGWLAWQTEGLQVHWTPRFVLALGWLVLVLSVGAVSLLNVLIRRGSAVRVASLFYLTPPTTALIAWGLFGETMTGLALLGMAVAVFGVWLARAGR